MADIEKLRKRIAAPQLRKPAKIYEAIGRLKERYPRVARYHELAYDQQKAEFSWREQEQRKQRAEALDGSYLLKSSRGALSAEDIWRTCILLTRVESAFRALKSPLCERPIFHHLKRRVETHIFLCCWPITCWSALSAPSSTRVSTPRGKPCAVSFPLTKWLRCGSRPLRAVCFASVAIHGPNRSTAEI